MQAAAAVTVSTVKTQVAGNTPVAATGGVFAALLAKLNPTATKQQPQIPQAKIDPAKDDGEENTNLAAALAAMQNAAPLPAQQTPLAPKTGDAVTDVTKGAKPFADLKAVDPAQLREALTQPAQPLKPGTPTLPVMPAHGDEEDDGATPIAAPITAKDAPASADAAKTAANIAQHLMKPATPAQTTEALQVQFDAKQDGQNNGANGGANSDTGSQNNSRDRQNASNPQTGQQTIQPTQPATHTAQAAPQQPVDMKTDQPAPMQNGAASIQAAQPAQATPATLHIAQASQTAPQPDIAALAMTIAAKSQAGVKHFDIRLDPPELGRIEVHLSVDDSGKAQAHLTADKPQTLDLLQRDSSTLTKSLKDSGVDISNSGLQFSLRGQERDTSNAPRSFGKARALSVTAVTEAAPSSTTVASDSSRLDIRV